MKLLYSKENATCSKIGIIPLTYFVILSIKLKTSSTGNNKGNLTDMSQFLPSLLTLTSVISPSIILSVNSTFAFFNIPSHFSLLIDIRHL